MQLTMIEINQIRDKYQKMAVNKWAKAGFKGSIFAGTGFGKSRVGVMAIGETLKRDSKANALILVPTTQLQYQFTEEFTKWGYEDCVNRIEVMCYQSAYKLIGEHYTIVVCDEVHLGLSIEYRKFFAHNMYDRLLCMTATLPEEDEYREKLLEIAPMVFSLSLDKCVSLGIVAPYSIYCLPVELSLLERDKYKKINNKFVYYKYALGNYDAFNQAKLALSNPQSPREEKEAAVGFYKCIRERKAIIDFAENKLTKFKEIVHSNLDKRILGFGGANEFTDMLTDSVSPLAVAYHSKKSKKQKQAALDAFKDGSINVLCSTKALNQGFDVPDANFGIICGITSKSLSMIQRVGRLIRFQEGKVGKIVIIYVKDSQEEKWLKNSVRQMKNVNWIAKSSDIV